MTRLRFELDRLYLVRSRAADDASSPPALVDASNRVRAMVLEVARPPSWALLRTVWKGVQAELEFPAPGIAASGTDGLQLWFALAEPIHIAQAHAFLQRLQVRFLPDIDAHRVDLMPASDERTLAPERHARVVPALQPSGNWSCFVAPDLAPVFADTPWLDTAPSEDGQAGLLSDLRTIEPAVFKAAAERLGCGPQPSTQAVPASAADDLAVRARITREAGEGDPQEFLSRVMNDDAVPLALRIEAAKALLQHAKTPDS